MQEKTRQSVRRGLFYDTGTCCETYGRAMAQSVSRWPVIVEARVRSQTSPCGIYVGQSDIGTGS